MTYGPQASWTAYRPKRSYYRGPSSVVVFPQPQPVEDHYTTRAVAQYIETAHHEAGHAVVSIATGWPVWKVLVRQDGSGICHNRPPSEKSLQNNLMAFSDAIAGWKRSGVADADRKFLAVKAVILASGRAAQLQYNPKADPSSWGPDYEKLRGLADLLHADAYHATAWLDEHVERAEKLVAVYRADIGAVAFALAAKGELGGDEVRAIVDGSSQTRSVDTGGVVRHRDCMMQLAR